MLVYRIEQAPQGPGPYDKYIQNDDQLMVACALLNKHNGSLKHPTPYLDGIRDFDGNDWLGSKGNDYCAFASKAQLKQWFNGWFTKLHKAGFVLSVYDAQPVKMGGRQCAFDPRDAKHIKSVPVSKWRSA